jgi:hypothetical protein
MLDSKTNMKFSEFIMLDSGFIMLDSESIMFNFGFNMINSEAVVLNSEAVALNSEAVMFKTLSVLMLTNVNAKYFRGPTPVFPAPPAQPYTRIKRRQPRNVTKHRYSASVPSAMNLYSVRKLSFGISA